MGNASAVVSGNALQTRASVLAKCEILILDEATSQIDVESERLIHEALADFGNDRTLS